MDEDFEEDGLEEDSLTVGEQVIVHTEEGYETGVMLGAGDAGVRLQVTHRAVRVEPELSEREKVMVRAAVEGLSRMELLHYGWDVLGKGVVMHLKREALVKVCVADAMERQLEGRKTVETLKPLTRPVSTFVPWHTISKIVSFSEWNEEQTLRPYEASLADVEKT